MERSSSSDPTSENRQRYVARLIASGNHGDIRIARKAVEGMVEELQGRTLPVGIEHDPTQPPVGRILGGKLVELENGEVAVESVIEVFESTGPARLISVSQLLDAIAGLPPVPVDEGPLTLEVDPRSYAIADIEPLVTAARTAGPVERSDRMMRFSVLPDALLVIAISAPFWFTKGFFTRLGENAGDAVSVDLIKAYTAFKARVRDLVSQRREPHDRPPITLLTLNISRPGGGVVEVEGSCRAEDQELDHFLDSGSDLFTIARAYLELADEPERLDRMHFRFTDGRWQLAYGLDEASERVLIIMLSDAGYAKALEQARE